MKKLTIGLAFILSVSLFSCVDDYPEMEVQAESLDQTAPDGGGGQGSGGPCGC